MPECRKLPQRWTMEVCPACNGQAQRGSGLDVVHTGDCPNRGRLFVLQTVHVVPEPRPVTTDPNDPGFSIYDEAQILREALEQIERRARGNVLLEVEQYGKPVGDYDELEGLAADALAAVKHDAGREADDVWS